METTNKQNTVTVTVNRNQGGNFVNEWGEVRVGYAPINQSIDCRRIKT